MRSFNKQTSQLNVVYELIGKGVNSYTAPEKEQLLYYTRLVSSNIINEKNNAVLNRIQFGERLDLINQQETIAKYLSEVPQDQIFIARIRINPIFADKYSLDLMNPKVLSNHFLGCKVKDFNIYAHMFTSNPRADTPYNVFSPECISTKKGIQSISKYSFKLEFLYISEIEIIGKKNRYGINVDNVTHLLVENGYFTDDIHYNNKYYSLLVDETRLNKVKKNIDIIYPLDA